MRPSIPVLSLLLLLASPSHAEDILIGTGSKSGVYFQVGRAICHETSPHGYGEWRWMRSEASTS